MDLKVTPAAPKPLQPAALDFTVRDPWKSMPVSKFQIVHEKLFHMFVVSQDLKVFLHNHPTLQPDGTFRWISPSGDVLWSQRHGEFIP